MGRIFLEHLGGNRIITCKKCGTYLSSRDEIESTHYQGASGRAYLFRSAVNLTHSQIFARDMISGKHYVRDVFCKKCNEKLGWEYDLAVPPDQRHKEGKVILEKVFFDET